MVGYLLLSIAMKRILSFVPIFLIVFFLTGCSGNNEWTGFYYKDKDNIGDQSTWVIQPGLNSKESCLDWVDQVAGDNRNFDYECGYKCQYKKDYGLTVCKETVK